MRGSVSCGFSNNEYWQESDIQKMAPEFIKLAVSLSQSEKILVICWKTIRLDTKNTGNADTLENPDLGVLGFPEILRRVLLDAGGKGENIFITTAAQAMIGGATSIGRHPASSFLANGGCRLSR